MLTPCFHLGFISVLITAQCELVVLSVLYVAAVILFCQCIECHALKPSSGAPWQQPATKPDSTWWDSHKSVLDDVLHTIIESWNAGQNEILSSEEAMHAVTVKFFSSFILHSHYFFLFICLSFSSESKPYLCCVIDQLFHIYSRASLCLVFRARVVKTIHSMEESTQAPIFSCCTHVGLWTFCFPSEERTWREAVLSVCASWKSCRSLRNILYSWSEVHFSGFFLVWAQHARLESVFCASGPSIDCTDIWKMWPSVLNGKPRV